MIPFSQEVSKMTKTVITAILMMLFSQLVWAEDFAPTSPASADTTSINTKNILRLFPICELASSLGQRCIYDFVNIRPTGFLEVCCQNGQEISYTENSVEVFSADNWLYRFEINPLPSNFAQVIFEDKAMNGGSYHTAARYITHFNDGELSIWKYWTTRY
jgi:hypothetical protein